LLQPLGLAISKSPGANDNGSAIAALFELARAFVAKRLSRTLRLVAFTNEERLFTRTQELGSRLYAQRRREPREKIRVMICLATIVYCSEQKGSQRLSLMGLLLPRLGNSMRVQETGVRRDYCAMGIVCSLCIAMFHAKR
jgi:Zn-dependent M28 family amino/carboxypeptidase